MRNEYDYSILRARILDKYDSLNDFALAINMKPSTLKSKMENRTDFRMNDITKILDALYPDGRIPYGEIDKLFFKPSKLSVALDVMRIITKDLTPDELHIVAEVMNLTTNRPDRREFALNWKGRMTDLPAALAQI